ncbi:hypothetical protein ACFXTH_008559 [Malus domestica]
MGNNPGNESRLRQMNHHHCCRVTHSLTQRVTQRPHRPANTESSPPSSSGLRSEQSISSSFLKEKPELSAKTWCLPSTCFWV